MKNASEIEIKPDVPIEVTENQYKILKKELSGAIAHREDNGRFYIKVWSMECADFVKWLIARN